MVAITVRSRRRRASFLPYGLLNLGPGLGVWLPGARFSHVLGLAGLTRSAAPAAARAPVADAGAVGGSIEDWDREGYLYEVGLATERIRAAAEAARALPFPFTLTARAENYLRGNPDLDDTIARLQAYESAGADVVYAPRLADLQDLRTLCQAVSRPVNVLAMPGISMADLIEVGAQRVSVGGRLTWVAAKALADAAMAIRDHGDFSSMAASVPLEEWFGG